MKIPRRPATTEPGDPAASMALLNEVLDRPVDPGYHTAAAGRVALGKQAQTSGHSPLLVISVLLLGFLLSVAAVALRTPDPQGLEERSELADRVEAQSSAGDAYAERIDELRVAIAAREAEQSSDSDTDTAPLVAAAAEQAGGVALTGPGVVVTVDDAPQKDADLVGASDRVLASDLQTLVNGLWAQQAEAISINEQRLTSTSSIRFAGEAIIVDFRGLNRPYVVRAIGDPEALVDELDSGGTGQYFDDVVSEYGIVIQWEANDNVQTPAAERLTTRVARADSDGGDG